MWFWQRCLLVSILFLKTNSRPKNDLHSIAGIFLLWTIKLLDPIESLTSIVNMNMLLSGLWRFLDEGRNISQVWIIGVQKISRLLHLFIHVVFLNLCFMPWVRNLFSLEETPVGFERCWGTPPVLASIHSSLTCIQKGACRLRAPQKCPNSNNIDDWLWSETVCNEQLQCDYSQNKVGQGKVGLEACMI